MKLALFRTTTNAVPADEHAQPEQVPEPAGPAVPAEPADLLVRLHNQVGAAVDITGNEHAATCRALRHRRTR